MSHSCRRIILCVDCVPYFNFIFNNNKDEPLLLSVPSDDSYMYHTCTFCSNYSQNPYVQCINFDIFSRIEELLKIFFIHISSPPGDSFGSYVLRHSMAHEDRKAIIEKYDKKRRKVDHFTFESNKFIQNGVTQNFFRDLLALFGTEYDEKILDNLDYHNVNIAVTLWGRPKLSYMYFLVVQYLNYTNNISIRDKYIADFCKTYNITSFGSPYCGLLYYAGKNTTCSDFTDYFTKKTDL